MTTSNKHKKGSREASGRDLGILAGVGLAVCCGLPLLVGASTLAAIGGVFRSAWLASAGLGLLLATLVYYARRRSTAASCCPPGAAETIDTSVRAADE